VRFAALHQRRPEPRLHPKKGNSRNFFPPTGGAVSDLRITRRCGAGGAGVDDEPLAVAVSLQQSSVLKP
jgi:hypothetical protein